MYMCICVYMCINNFDQHRAPHRNTIMAHSNKPPYNNNTLSTFCSKSLCLSIKTS